MLLLIPLLPFLGFLVGAGAVVLGFLGKAKEPAAPKWMWIVGLILGFVGVLIGLIYLIVFLAGLAILASVPGSISSY